MEATVHVYSDVPTNVSTADIQARKEAAEGIIRRNVYWALGAGVVPIPIADILAVSAVEVKLLRELSNLYNVKFTEHIASKIVSSLLTGIGSVGIGAAIGGSLAKIVPVIGTTLGIVSVPVLSGAITHAIGKVMMMHLESGGTLLDFNPIAMRAYFRDEFEKAKVIVAQQHQAAKSSSPS